MKYKFHRIKIICELITLICKILFYLSHTPSKHQKEVKIMGKDLKGNELGKGITQRKDGRYQARIYASKDSKTLCFYGFNLDELKKKRDSIIQSRVKPHQLPNTSITFEKWFEQWMATYKVGRIKNTTLRNYQASYNRCKTFLENKRIGDLKELDFQNLIDNLYDIGYSASIVKPTFSAINQCMQKAADNHLISFNPCKGVTLKKKSDFKPVKKSKEETKRLTEEEISLFFSAAQNVRYAEIFYILLHTGLRSGELCALEWSDIDIESRTIHIYKTLTRITKYYDNNGMKLQHPIQEIQITTPKQESSNRYIPLSENVMSAFHKWKEKQEHDKYNLKSYWGRENKLLKKYPDLIFTTIHGNCLTPNNLSAECKRICDIINTHNREDYSTKIHIHPHLFRHTFISQCYESGMDPLTVSLIVGHSKSEMTMYYTHLKDDFIKKEYNKYTDYMNINLFSKENDK